jgi:hypothetical protein
MSRLTPKNKVLLFALLSACAAGAAVGGMHYLVKAKQTALQSERDAVRALEAEESADRAVRSLVRDTEDRRAELERRFIFSAGIVDFLEELESLATVTGAQVSIRAVDEGEGAVALTRSKTLTHPNLTVSLTAEGTWSAVYHTLVALESLPYAVRVEQVNLDSSPGTNIWVAAVRFSVAMQ